jgi:hypothetical protein
MKWLFEGHWIPRYAAQLMIVLSGMALIFQQKAAAHALFLLGIGAVIMPVFMDAASSTAEPVVDS